MENTSGSYAYADAGDGGSYVGVHVFQLVYHVIIVFFGVPGNCLILRVYWKKTLKTSTHVFIMGLAWADLAVCLLHSLDIVERAVLLMGSLVPQWLNILYSFQYIALGTSSVLTGVVAADRYDCVCRPQHRFFTHTRGKIAAFASPLVSFLMNIPGFVASSSNFSNPLEVVALFATQFAKFVAVLLTIALCYGKVYLTIRRHARVGGLVTVRGESSVRPDSDWSTRFPPSVKDNIEQSANNTFNSGSGISALTLHSSSVPVASQVLPPVLSLSEQLPPAQESTEGTAIRSRFQNGNAAVLQRKTTRMLFVTSLVFLLTWLPYWIYAAVTISYFTGALVNPSPIGVLREISYIVYINNAVNPLIYGIANRRFRKDCREVLRKIKLCS